MKISVGVDEVKSLLSKVVSKKIGEEIKEENITFIVQSDDFVGVSIEIGSLMSAARGKTNKEE